jgi:hypothetical protein
MSLAKKIAKQHNFSSEAPDMLLKKISELENTLNAAKEAPNKSQKAIDFYTGILGTMKYAWAYMVDMEWIHKRLKMVEGENEFLKEWAGSLQDRLLKYEVIEQLKLSGDFEKVVEAVDIFMSNNTITE